MNQLHNAGGCLGRSHQCNICCTCLSFTGRCNFVVQEWQHQYSYSLRVRELLVHFNDPYVMASESGYAGRKKSSSENYCVLSC